jgi:hypothetical protein
MLNAQLTLKKAELTPLLINNCKENDAFVQSMASKRVLINSKKLIYLY